MFINLSNHPSSSWSANQLENARQYGEVLDIPFPDVPPVEGEEYIASLSVEYAHEIIEHYDPSVDVIHIMGEMCFSFALVRLLQESGFVCVASTSERIVKEDRPGHKEVFFNFIRFRQYGS